MFKVWLLCKRVYLKGEFPTFKEALSAGMGSNEDFSILVEHLGNERTLGWCLAPGRQWQGVGEYFPRTVAKIPLEAAASA